MLRHFNSVSVLLLLLVASCVSGFADSGRGTIFREVRVRSGLTIVLGEKFRASNIATAIDVHTYELQKGSFSGATRIRVTVSDMDIVRSVTFVYDTHVTFSHAVASYKRTLGEPTAVNSQGNEVGLYWSDGLTRFEVLKPTSDQPEVRSRMIDLANSN